MSVNWRVGPHLALGPALNETAWPDRCIVRGGALFDVQLLEGWVDLLWNTFSSV